MKTSEHLAAITAQKYVLGSEEWKLLTLIAFKRAVDGNRHRFPFKSSYMMNRRHYIAYFEDEKREGGGTWKMLYIAEAGSFKVIKKVWIEDCERMVREFIDEVE